MGTLEGSPNPPAMGSPRRSLVSPDAIDPTFQFAQPIRCASIATSSIQAVNPGDAV